MSLTKLSLAGKIKLFPARESLVSDILAGDGKLVHHFLQCRECAALARLSALLLPMKRAALIKKKIIFSSYIRKFRMEQLQSHI